jgi:undecaprenyl diphosphate synthase
MLQPPTHTAASPQHVAIIMDGNGRWAESRGLSRIEGHRKGAEAAQRAVETARDLGIPYVTLFSFSSENWNRPADEVQGLMDLLRFYLKKETAELHKSGARMRVIGDRERLSADIRQMIEQAEEITKDNTRITVVIALSYGGRQDIAFAARAIARGVKAGEINPETVDENLFSGFLMTKDIPDPDLVIRTSGEMRISNFLLWQMAYAEIYFTPTLWPDFDKAEMEKAIRFFAERDRRYGGLSAKTAGQQA